MRRLLALLALAACDGGAGSPPDAATDDLRAACLDVPQDTDAAPLVDALATLIENGAGAADRVALAAATQGVPADLARALASVVLATLGAEEAWQAITRSLSPDDLSNLSIVDG